MLIIIAIMAVLTWIIPAGQYKVDDAGVNAASLYIPMAGKLAMRRPALTRTPGDQCITRQM